MGKEETPQGLVDTLFQILKNTLRPRTNDDMSRETWLGAENKVRMTKVWSWGICCNLSLYILMASLRNFKRKVQLYSEMWDLQQRSWRDRRIPSPLNSKWCLLKQSTPAILLAQPMRLFPTHNTLLQKNSIQWSSLTVHCVNIQNFTAYWILGERREWGGRGPLT